MAMQREVVVVSGVRTAIGDFGGGLKDVAPTDLGAQVVREALSRAGVDGDEVGQVVFGNVIHTEPKDMYMARVAAMNAGVAKDAPALTLNRLCGSGLQAIVSAAQTIMLGDTDIAIGGGVESMSRAPYLAQGVRWGARMGDAAMVDMMLAALHDPFDNIHMGETAENLAESHQITRGDQDALALESHRRAAHAISEGRFKAADPAGHAEDAERRDGVRHRRARARRRDARGSREAAAGVPEGRHGDRRQRVRHQRWRRRGGADGTRDAPKSAA